MMKSFRPRRAVRRQPSHSDFTYEALERRALMCALPLGSGNNGDLAAVHYGWTSSSSSPPVDSSSREPSVTSASPDAVVVYGPPAGVPRLSSLPGAPANVYLDFDGDSDGREHWDAYDIDGNPAKFSAAERALMREAFHRVAEIYSPFNLNVTTVVPAPADDVPYKTMRVVIGSDGTGNPGFGVVPGFETGLQRSAYAASQADAVDLAFVIAHEVGHGFGLHHQSRFNASGQKVEEYRTADLRLPAALMGQRNRDQREMWYLGPNTRGDLQDDLARIASTRNGFGYRPDEYGDSPAAATPLALAGGRAAAPGVIHHHDEQDWLRFEWDGGPVAIALDGAPRTQTLNARLELRDAAGNLIAADVDDVPGGSIVRPSLPAGSYVVGVIPADHEIQPDGPGTATVRTRYGEVGQYTVRVQAGTSLGAPFGGAPIRVHGDAPVTVEFEDFDRDGFGVAPRPGAPAALDWAYRGYEAAGMDFSRGEASFSVRVISDDWLEYSIDVGEAGTYKVQARGASGLDTSRFRVILDGGAAAGPQVAIPPRAGQQTVDAGSFTLSAGRHVLRVEMSASEPGAWLMNWLRLTKSTVPDQAPYPAGGSHVVSFAGPAVIQAEDYDRGGGGVAYHDLTPSTNTGGAYRAAEGVDLKPTTDAGGGHRVSDAAAGEWLEYTLDVADGGAYELEVRAGSLAAGGAFHLEVDGVHVGGRLEAPNTGSYDAMQTVRGPRVELEPGRHVLRLAFDADAGTSGAAGGFNWIRLTRADRPRVSIAAVDPIATEAGLKPARIRLTRAEDPALAQSSLKFRLAYGGTAVAGEDYSRIFGEEWTFGSSVTQGEYDFTPIQDNLVEGDETITIRIVPHPDYVIDGPDTVTLTLRDDDGGGGGTGTTTATLRAAADAYVRDGSHAGTNFGTATQMQVKKGAAGWNREAYLRFDFAGVEADVSSAKLRLFGRLDNTSAASVGYAVYSATNTTWSETGLTWNNRPAGGAAALKGGTVAGTTGKWYELDLTSYVKERKAAGATAVTLVVRTPTASASTILFDTDEAANRPALVVTSGAVTPPPPPPPPASTALRAAEDTYVRDGSTYAATTFGTASQLQLKQGATGWNREAYLKFDLSGVSTVNSARLRLFGRLDNTQAAGAGFAVFTSPNTIWSETSVNWHGRLATGASSVGGGTVSGTAGKWYEVDLTAFLQQLKAGGATAVTLVLRATSASPATIVFDSDEAAANRPELVVG
jgi:hypothetical protein